MPRRAVLHRYPVIGRFAAFARKRSYLWSFRAKDVRPAFYLGSVLSLWPVMGIQVPVAFALCLVARTNFMVAAALQLITNPLTAAPIYFGTFKLGKAVLEWLHVATGGKATPLLDSRSESASLSLESVEAISWSESAASTFGALAVGGTLAGLALACVLDVSFLIATRKRAA